MAKIEVWVLASVLCVSTVLALNVTQELKVEILPGGIFLDITSPVNNTVYATRQILVNATFGTDLTSFTLSRNGGLSSTLCRRCNKYSRTKPFDDGLNQITFTALHPVGTHAVQTITFWVDSQKPRIRKTLPTHGLSNGSLTLMFEEENPRTLLLTYGVNTTTTRLIPLSDCVRDRADYTCRFTPPDIALYDQQDITYSFSVTDIRNQTTISREHTLSIDARAPAIASLNLSRSGRAIIFLINITEQNFQQVDLHEISAAGTRARTLCTHLRAAVCEKRVSFTPGEYNLSLSLQDKAGNIYQQPLSSVMIL